MRAWINVKLKATTNKLPADTTRNDSIPNEKEKDRKEIETSGVCRQTQKQLDKEKQLVSRNHLNEGDDHAEKRIRVSSGSAFLKGLGFNAIWTVSQSLWERPWTVSN